MKKSLKRKQKQKRKSKRVKQRGGNDGNIPESRPEGENGNIVKLGPDEKIFNIPDDILKLEPGGNDGNIPEEDDILKLGPDEKIVNIPEEDDILKLGPEEEGKNVNILVPEGNDSNIPSNLIMHTDKEKNAMKNKFPFLDYHFFYINNQKYYTNCINEYKAQYTDNPTLTWNQFMKNKFWEEYKKQILVDPIIDPENKSYLFEIYLSELERKLKAKIIIVPRIKTGDKQPYSPYIFFADYIYFKNGKRLLPGLVSVNVEIIKQKFDAINDISNDRDRYSDRQDKIYGMERIEKKYKTNTLLKKYFQET